VHHLGVPTTRALSLVVSRKEAVRRHAPEQSVRALLVEPCAMTCRVAPSFIRVGQVELYGRRILDERHRRGVPPNGGGDSSAAEEDNIRQLDKLITHALQREFGGTEAATLQERAQELLSKTALAVSSLAAQWIRVGFCQGNFNSDNCLVSGRTMDYGPFGFVEAYSPEFGPWVGSGSHFAFMNQGEAGLMNIQSLAEALSGVLEDDEDETWTRVRTQYMEAFLDHLNEVFRQKLGLDNWSMAGEHVKSNLLRLMEACAADWTITWRQLPLCLLLTPEEQQNDEQLFSPLNDCEAFSQGSLTQQDEAKWCAWLREWIAVVSEGTATTEERSWQERVDMMRAASPKYVPREWMLKALR